MSQLQLEGHAPTPFDMAAEWRRKVGDLQSQLEKSAQDYAALEEEHQRLKRAVSALRQQLTPYYIVIRAVFGEIDLLGLPEPGDAFGGGQQQGNPKWETWRKRFPGRGAELIDLLLVQEQMNTKQLSTALKCDPRTLAQLIYKLNQAGLIQKNGNMYSLKEL